jgi:hypothetical protein
MTQLQALHLLLLTMVMVCRYMTVARRPTCQAYPAELVPAVATICSSSQQHHARPTT